MKKTLCLLFALLLVVGLNASALARELPKLLLSVEDGSLTLTLEDNSAARSLLSQLPLTLTFEDYNGTEKIAYPPEGLDLSDAPESCDPDVGTLAYYAPWGNLCIFYQDFRYSEGLVAHFGEERKLYNEMNGMLVNPKGLRFTDDSDRGHDTAMKVMEQGGKCYMIFDSTHKSNRYTV